MSRIANGFTKMAHGTMGGQSRIATPASRLNRALPISGGQTLTGEFSMMVDAINFYSNTGTEDIVWTISTAVGGSPYVDYDPNGVNTWTPYIKVMAGVSIATAISTVRWEDTDPFNAPYEMRFVFLDSDFNVIGTDNHVFAGDGETVQSIELSAPFIFPDSGFISVEFDLLSNPSTNSSAPRGSISLTWYQT